MIFNFDNDGLSRFLLQNSWLKINVFRNSDYPPIPLILRARHKQSKSASIKIPFDTKYLLRSVASQKLEIKMYELDNCYEEADAATISLPVRHI